MLCSSQSNVLPTDVTLEQLPDKTIVRLADNVEEIQIEEQTIYQYDEVEFTLPEDRQETRQSIAEHFEEWWLYGTEDHTEPTLEERVSLLEEIIMEE